jgi:Secretion system C-terminal sorting domain
MKKHYLMAALTALTIFLNIGAKAQLVDCNVFLQGRYVEVGVNWLGAYGSATSAPAGYHANTDQSFYNAIACDSVVSYDTTYTPILVLDSAATVIDTYYYRYTIYDTTGTTIDTTYSYIPVYDTTGSYLDTTVYYYYDSTTFTVDSVDTVLTMYTTVFIGYDTIPYPYTAYITDSIGTDSTYYTYPVYAYDTTGYDTTVAATSGYITGNKLGFVADPAMDGWDVGTPAYFGDYFLPGDPQEGWAISADGHPLVDAYNTVMQSSSFVSGLTGGNVSYTTSGGTVTSTWQGLYADSIAVTQVTSLDTSSLYFSVTVTLTNLATTPVNNLYYMRELDPDNEEPETSDFTTTNVIQYQYPDAVGASVVTAVGTTYTEAYLGLGSTDSIARVFVLSSGLTPAPTDSLSQLYNGTATDLEPLTVGTTLTADVGIGVVFNVGRLAAADTLGATDSSARTMGATHPNSKVIHYFYSFSPAATDSAIAKTAAKTDTSSIGSLSVQNINATHIGVYPNPVSNTLTVTGLVAGDHLMIYDMMGRQVSGSWNATNGGKGTFNTSSLTPGSYQLKITDANGNLKAVQPLQKQ